MTANDSSHSVDQTAAEVGQKRRGPRLRISKRRCFNPGCEGWIHSEFHGQFQIGPVTYRQYMNCKCNQCGAEAEELVRSRVEGRPELNGPRFLLHDPELDCFHEVPGFGQSMLPYVQHSYRTGQAMEVLIDRMLEAWLHHARQDYLLSLEEGLDGGAEC